MGIGIVSIGLFFDREAALFRIWLAAAGVTWLAVAGLVARELLRDRGWARTVARHPASLTGVAATAVLGTGLRAVGFGIGAVALLVAAALIWAWCAAVLVRHRELPRTGTAFMLTVSTQSLATLTAIEADTPWLTYTGMALCALGLTLYVPALARFDLRALKLGAGDQWVAGGALAISALAMCEVSLSASGQSVVRPLASAISVLAAATWIASIIWLPLLAVAEIRWPRPRYDLARWSTLFPVGMYAASGFEVGRISHLAGATSFATVWVWVGVALSVVLAAGLVRR